MRLVRNVIAGMGVSFLTGAISLSVHASEPTIRTLSALPDVLSVYRVIDTRPIDQCLAASLPNARCLPYTFFYHPDGDVIDYPSLRWLLGTVGLRGDESVLLVSANNNPVRGVADLLHTAGQAHVSIYDGPIKPSPTLPNAQGRSFSRETVYTAPMRINL